MSLLRARSSAGRAPPWHGGGQGFKPPRVHPIESMHIYANKKVKIVGLVFAAVALYYGLQYASSAVHYNCAIIKDDCPPPIYGASELIYRVMVRPSWLDQFEIDPMTFFFKDGQFSFWEGEVNGKAVVIRVREDGSPLMQWIFEEGLPGGISIHPAGGRHVKQWLEAHPEYKLSK